MIKYIKTSTLLIILSFWLSIAATKSCATTPSDRPENILRWLNSEKRCQFNEMVFATIADVLNRNFNNETYKYVLQAEESLSSMCRSMCNSKDNQDYSILATFKQNYIQAKNTHNQETYGPFENIGFLRLCGKYSISLIPLLIAHIFGEIICEALSGFKKTNNWHRKRHLKLNHKCLPRKFKQLRFKKNQEMERFVKNCAVRVLSCESKDIFHRWMPVKIVVKLLLANAFSSIIGFDDNNYQSNILFLIYCFAVSELLSALKEKFFNQSSSELKKDSCQQKQSTVKFVKFPLAVTLTILVICTVLKTM